MGTDDAASGYEFAVPRGKTNVPEFHDCQRLRIPITGGRTTYGPLAAVFAAVNLDSSVHTLAAPRVVAMTYLPQGGRYLPLKMTDRFGCVVLAGGSSPTQAWMVPVDRDTKCNTAANTANLTSARLLRVRAIPSPPTGPPPPVARWDWDQRNQTQYIGVRCGTNWCEVGPRGGFTSSASHAPSPAFPAYGSRGAYDEQVLAEWTGGQITPGANLGTIVPTPGLDRIAVNPPDQGRWVDVARIHMWPGPGIYEDDFNFVADQVAATSTSAATLSLCRHSTAARCPSGSPGVNLDASACNPVGNEVWIARVRRPGKPAQFTCILYRAHGGTFTIPPVVRWRWRANDETIWISCPKGCCEVKATT